MLSRSSPLLLLAAMPMVVAVTFAARPQLHTHVLAVARALSKALAKRAGASAQAMPRPAS